MSEPAVAGRTPSRRIVPCFGHSFDERLRCRCGIDWWAHQLAPVRCPVDARRQNRHGGAAPPERPAERPPG